MKKQVWVDRFRQKAGMIARVNDFLGHKAKFFFCGLVSFSIIIRRDNGGISQRIEGICHNSYNDSDNEF